MRTKIIIWGLIIALCSCTTKQECTIIPGSDFSGKGLIILRRGQGQDGLFSMMFFPVCDIDTADLVGSLNRAEIGLAFSTSAWYKLIGPTTYGQLRSPYKEKASILTTEDLVRKNIHCWDCGLNKVFIIPVNISFSDTLSEPKNRNKIFNYSLKTKEAFFKLRLRSTSIIKIHAISAFKKN